ncbi:MAG: hypothetical protein IJ507_05500 [Clostridia bacterium]|nr:hypothetical protein [Clostridia bacterium]
MLRTLRLQVNRLSAEAGIARRIALRRSDRTDALLATNLPLLAEEDETSAFIALCMREGWRVIPLDNGWLALDHPVPVPHAAAPEIPPGETGCCLSLLMRHPGGEAPAEWIRALVKADEAGRAEVEKLCRRWHGEMAAMLRRHEALPGGLLPYLCAAVGHHTTEEEGI